jgi:hypothetical protein
VVCSLEAQGTEWTESNANEESSVREQPQEKEERVNDGCPSNLLVTCWKEEANASALKTLLLFCR